MNSTVIAEKIQIANKFYDEDSPEDFVANVIASSI